VKMSLLKYILIKGSVSVKTFRGINGNPPGRAGSSHLFHGVLTETVRHAFKNVPRDEGEKQVFSVLHPS
jgi:hypothetical protein